MLGMNISFIDGQNLNLGTKERNWKVSHMKFRTYLKDMYDVEIAYYFLGHRLADCEGLYKKLEKCGYILIFKSHENSLTSKKKGNVDTDMVFEVMKNIIDNAQFEQAVMVSGDGDYFKLVTYLITKNKLRKILFPNGNYSSLYNPLGSEFFDVIENIRQSIEFIPDVNEKGS